MKTFRIYYADGNQKLFGADTMRELLQYLAEEEENEIWKIEEAEEYNNLPRTYAEIEYEDMDSIEAYDGCRFDDMNYLRYTER